MLDIKEDRKDKRDNALHETLFTLAGALEGTAVNLEVHQYVEYSDRVPYKTRYWTEQGCRALSKQLRVLQVRCCDTRRK